MKLNCPHCHNPMEVLKPVEEITCPSCGSSVLLDPDRTETFIPAGQPRQIDKYELIEEVGHGAFGTVYKARDTELDRTVAVKVPRSGNLATREDADRFLREARSAAQLEHSGIVSVYDAGREENTCYLVSEFVQGETLADRLQRTTLSFRDAAGLIAELAEALDYAHGQGVIHRDLKPSNIMLDLEGNPHVMDFGLAKREAGEITMTMEGQVLGTPAYMSPEQASGASHHVDRRSDVYSLGVILYELLTGELPFRGNKRMLIVQVLQDEPRAPRWLNDHIPRDLETICLKCLRKDAAQRYQTTGALAADLRRFLEGESISARPVGRIEKTWRWCRRRPAVTGLTAAFVAAVVGGFCGVVWQWRAAVDNLAEADRQRIRAQENFTMAREAVDQYLNRITEDPRLKEHGFELLRRDLLESARSYYERLIEVEADSTELQVERAEAFWRLARITDLLGSKPEAISYYQRAVAAYDELARDHAVNRDYPLASAQILGSLFDVYVQTGDDERAGTTAADALQRWERLASTQVTNPVIGEGLVDSQIDLGRHYLDVSRFDDAEAAYTRALKTAEQLGDESPGDPAPRTLQAQAHSWLASFFQSRDQLELAEQEANAAIKIWEALTLQHSDERFERELLQSREMLARIYIDSLRAEQAESVYREIEASREQLVRDHPDVPSYQHELGVTYTFLTAMYYESGRYDQAQELFDKLIPLRERLVQQYPDILNYAIRLAGDCCNRSKCYGLADDNENSVEWATRAIRILEEVLGEKPNDSTAALFLRNAYGNKGGALQDLERHQEALVAFDRAIELDSGGRFVPGTQIRRALSFVRLGDHSAGIQLMQQWLPDENLRRNNIAEYLASVYNCACIYSLASEVVSQDEGLSGTDRERVAEEYADNAVVLLRKGWEAGDFRDQYTRSYLLEDNDLDPIRSREGFQSFVTELGLGEKQE